mmetsp:Transcript_1612/g.9936  ORF Transcript_1612/g.9936 Transcript_1612/m.9936 type:complete len:286 (-) Transcript_1612:57-914(-)
MGGPHLVPGIDLQLPFQGTPCSFAPSLLCRNVVFIPSKHHRLGRTTTFVLFDRWFLDVVLHHCEVVERSISDVKVQGFLQLLQSFLLRILVLDAQNFSRHVILVGPAFAPFSSAEGFADAFHGRYVDVVGEVSIDPFCYFDSFLIHFERTWLHDELQADHVASSMHAFVRAAASGPPELSEVLVVIFDDESCSVDGFFEDFFHCTSLGSFSVDLAPTVLGTGVTHEQRGTSFGQPSFRRSFVFGVGFFRGHRSMSGGAPTLPGADSNPATRSNLPHPFSPSSLTT